MPWEDRDVPVTFHQLLSRTATKFPDRNAISFQILSGPKDKAETLTWSQLLAKTNQAANLFRSLGVKENDVVAYVLMGLFGLLGLWAMLGLWRNAVAIEPIR